MTQAFGRMYCRVCVATMAAAALSIVGCGGKEKPAQELMVLCGSSFVEPTGQLCREFTEATGIATATSVAGSEEFLPQVKAAGLGDVLVTHDPYLEYVRDAGKYRDHVGVGYNVPVLAVQKGNPKRLARIEDLAQQGLTVGLTDPQYSTAGEMVYALLEEKGIKDAVLENVGNRLTRNHATLGTWLKTGTVDAVIIWGGVAHNFADSLDVVKTPYEYRQEIGVHVIGLNYTDQPESLKKFMDFIRTRGPEVFAEYGYVK